MLLEVNSITKTFGGLVAIHNLDFAINEGEVVGLIGPNGSGKTTSFNLISGFLKPEKGQIMFNGEDITGYRPHRICQCGIARTFQLTKPFMGLTALQNVMVGMMYGDGKVRNMAKAEMECEKILEFVGLVNKGQSPIGSFGTVDRKRLVRFSR